MALEMEVRAAIPDATAKIVESYIGKKACSEQDVISIMDKVLDKFLEKLVRQ